MRTSENKRIYLFAEQGTQIFLQGYLHLFRILSARLDERHEQWTRLLEHSHTLIKLTQFFDEFSRCDRRFCRDNADAMILRFQYRFFGGGDKDAEHLLSCSVPLLDRTECFARRGIASDDHNAAVLREEEVH